MGAKIQERWGVEDHPSINRVLFAGILQCLQERSNILQECSYKSNNQCWCWGIQFTQHLYIPVLIVAEDIFTFKALKYHKGKKGSLCIEIYVIPLTLLLIHNVTYNVFSWNHGFLSPEHSCINEQNLLKLPYHRQRKCQIPCIDNIRNPLQL